MSVNHDILEAKYRWREEKWLQPPTANDRVILWNKTKCGVQSGDMESHFTGDRDSRNSHFPLWLWHCCQASDYYYITFDEKIPRTKLHPVSVFKKDFKCRFLKRFGFHSGSDTYEPPTTAIKNLFIFHMKKHQVSYRAAKCYCQRMSLV